QRRGRTAVPPRMGWRQPNRMPSTERLQHQSFVERYSSFLPGVSCQQTLNTLALSCPLGGSMFLQKGTSPLSTARKGGGPAPAASRTHAVTLSLSTISLANKAGPLPSVRGGEKRHLISDGDLIGTGRVGRARTNLTTNHDHLRSGK